MLCWQKRFQTIQLVTYIYLFLSTLTLTKSVNVYQVSVRKPTKDVFSPVISYATSFSLFFSTTHSLHKKGHSECVYALTIIEYAFFSWTGMVFSSEEQEVTTYYDLFCLAVSRKVFKSSSNFRLFTSCYLRKKGRKY